MPRGLIIAVLCLALLAPVLPATAAPRPAGCPGMAAMTGQHMPPGPRGCPHARATGHCCLEQLPTDARPLALHGPQRVAPPPLAGGLLPALAPGWSSHPLEPPQPRARAPVPLYLSYASLLI